MMEDKKWMCGKVFQMKLEKKIIRKHSLSIKIFLKVHPALTEYLNEVVQVREIVMQDLLR